MTIQTTINAMQTINHAIDGVNSAPTAYPGSINSADLPMSIVWPAQGEDKQQALGSNMVLRTYRLAVYCKPIEQGQGINEGWSDTISLMQTVIETWLDSDNRRIVNDGTYTADLIVSNDRPIIDNGIEVLAYPPPALGVEGYPLFFGFELLMPVKEYWSES